MKKRLSPLQIGFLCLCLLALLSALVLYYVKEKYSDNVEAFVKDHLKEMKTNGAPNFELKTLEGSSKNLEDYKGKMVVVNFWASWCAPCIEEFPSMIELSQKYPNDLVILAISEDEEIEDVKVFLKAFDASKGNIIVLMDEDQKVSKLYGTQKLPESYILDRAHKLLRKVPSTQDWMSPSAQEFFKFYLSKK